MMNDATSDEPVCVTYNPRETSISDYVIAYHHLDYENYRMMFSRKWGRYFILKRFDASIVSAFAAVLVFIVALSALPGQAALANHWIFAPALLVAPAVWCTLWYYDRRANAALYRTAARWKMDWHRMYDTRYVLEVGKDGYSLSTKEETIKSSWVTYHLALVQPESLILVFHNTVAVIPNTVLPVPPEEVVERVHRWAALQNEKFLAVS